LNQAFLSKIVARPANLAARIRPGTHMPYPYIRYSSSFSVQLQILQILPDPQPWHAERGRGEPPTARQCS